MLEGDGDGRRWTVTLMGGAGEWRVMGGSRKWRVMVVMGSGE